MIGEDFLWYEKYRPRSVNDCILPKKVKALFLNFIAQGELPHFLFTGRAGIGKTTVARAICDDVGSESLFINASLNAGIDTLRTTITEFASTVSMTGSYKTVILDEADSMNPTSTQMAMRPFMEQYASNCRFILTCNYKSKIIEPIHSRCTTVDFTVPNEEKKDIMVQCLGMALKILKAEGIEHDPKIVAELVRRKFPDLRGVINTLQEYSACGAIDSGILIGTADAAYRELYALLKAKKFNEVRKWVATTSASPEALFKELYAICSDNLTDDSVPELIIILNDHQYKSAFVVDQELNTMSCLTQIMAGCKFK